MNSRTILMLSEQDMFRAGNQLLRRAIDGYVAGGFDVVFVTVCRPDPNVATAEELFGSNAKRVTVVRADTCLNRLGWRIRQRGWLRVGAWTSAAATDPAYPPLTDAVSFLERAQSHAALLTRLRLTTMRRVLVRAALGEASRHRIVLVAGHEIGGIPAAREVADALGVPFIVRFEGTFLCEPLRAGRSFDQYPLHHEASRTPFDLAFMDNDGTSGRDVLVALGHPPDRIRFWGDGVRQDLQDPQTDRDLLLRSLGIPQASGRRILLTLSKLGPWKRHDRIIAAMPGIIQRIPDAFLIVGHRGPMRPTLEALVDTMGLRSAVHFTGPLPHKATDALLHACDVYVNTNDHSNRSNTVLEALMCGKPVLSLDDGSLADLVIDGVNGRLVSIAALPDSLAQGACDILASPASARRMSEASLAIGRTRLWSWEARMAAEMEEIETLLGTRPAGPKIGHA